MIMWFGLGGFGLGVWLEARFDGGCVGMCINRERLSRGVGQVGGWDACY